MHASKHLSHLSVVSVCRQWNVMFDGVAIGCSSFHSVNAFITFRCNQLHRRWQDEVFADHHQKAVIQFM